MKTCIFTLGLLLWNTLQALATANVTFAAPANYKLKITINGKTEEATQYVRFEQLSAGDHTAQIAATANNETLTFQSIIALPDNQETSYFVFIVNKTVQLHWANESPIQSGTPVASTQAPDYNSRVQKPVDNNRTDRFPSSQGSSYTNRPTSGYGSGRGYHSDRPGYGYDNGTCYDRSPNRYTDLSCGKSYTILSNQEMAQLQATIRRISFDDDRLMVLQNTLQYSAFMAADVRDIMKLLSFDSGRLKFAKMAFNNTVDKQNYYIVNTAFDFSSSTRELNQYLHQGHH